MARREAGEMAVVPGGQASREGSCEGPNSLRDNKADGQQDQGVPAGEQKPSGEGGPGLAALRATPPSPQIPGWCAPAAASALTSRRRRS